MDLAAAAAAAKSQQSKRESPLLLHSPIPIHRPVSVASPPKKEYKTNNLTAEEDSTVLLSQIMYEDEDTRPSPSYKELIIEAIESVPEKRLKLSEIYQVIKYHYPFYHRRADQWGWQNSIRHNLSLHDCFIKLPLKQTSASGVVGHYWTINREVEEKQASTRKRNRASGTKHTKHCPSSKVPNYISQNLKGKDRQSVSSLDSGMMSEESQANSPASGLADSSMQPPKSFLFPMLAPASSTHMPSLSNPTNDGLFSPNNGLFSPNVQLSMADSLAMSSKHQLLADLLSTTSTAAPSTAAAPVATSSYSLTSEPFPIVSQLNGLDGLLTTSQAEAMSGSAGADAISDMLSLCTNNGNVVGELQRLQLLNLYMYQQGLLQRIMVDNNNASNNGIFGLNAQSPVEMPVPRSQLIQPSGEHNQIAPSILAQIILSKLGGNPAASCHKVTPPQSPSCPDTFSSRNTFQNVQLTTHSPETMVNNTAAVIPENADPSVMNTYRQLLEQYMLNNNPELKMDPIQENRDENITKRIKESDPILI